jgi:cell division protein FtsI (penicillin-binding protein 3)
MRFFVPARFFAVIAFFAVWGLLAAGRLLQFQVVQRDRYSKPPPGKYTRTRTLKAPRGTIYDSRMGELAADATVETVAAEPEKIQDIADASARLARVLELDPSDLRRRMIDPARAKYIRVKRRIGPSTAERVRALGIRGVYLEKEDVRVYPNRDLASHTLGFVNMDGIGAAGLEMHYDQRLRGKNGKAVCEVDAFGRCYQETISLQPEPGHSLVLSIDRHIQHIVQRELAKGVRQARAAAGTAIVMESETGRILALANHPDFNSNTYGRYAPELWRNRAVQDQFEPGSTFKVVVAGAALEAGLIRPGETIHCGMGSIKVGGHVFHDHHPYGWLTFQQILENSSNVGAILLGMRLGEDRLYAALRSFGFGSPTGVDLPAEADGKVRETPDWSALSIAAISFGQEVAVTSMQILAAINAIANGGYRVRPSVVDRILDGKGACVQTTRPERVRIMRPETAAAVRNAFEGVVLRGTGKRASLEGYRAAGKTGTAQKQERGRFSKTKYLASFIGFAPLPFPRVTILVQIDEPRGAIYGGEVAAPVFREIAQETLLSLHILPDKSLLPAESGPTARLRSAVMADSAGD